MATNALRSARQASSQPQLTSIVKDLDNHGIEVPAFLQTRLTLAVQLPPAIGGVTLSQDGTATIHTVDWLLRRFAGNSQLYPEVFQICEHQIREGKYYCKIRNDLGELRRLFTIAEQSQENGDTFSRDAYLTLLPVMYMGTLGRAACRFLIGPELEKLLRPLHIIYQDQRLSAKLKSDIDRAVARVRKFLPSTFTDAEQAAFTPHDHGEDDIADAKGLMLQLLVLLIVPEQVDSTDGMMRMERVNEMITSQVCPCYKVMCVSIASTVAPRRSFPLAESYMLRKVIEQQRAQWQLDGVLGTEPSFPGDTGAAYLVDLPTVDQDEILDTKINGISTEEFQFPSAHAAERFLYEPRIKVELGDDVVDDVDIISDYRPQAVKRLVEAIASKCKVYTKSDDFSTLDARNDRAKEDMIERFQDYLNARGTPMYNKQFLAAKAEAAVDMLIKLHTEGLPLYWAHLPDGAERDLGLTATERFQALLDLCTDIKAIPIDWISEAGSDVVMPAVLAPRKYYSVKLAGARGNKTKKQTAEKGKAAAEKLARMEKEKAKDNVEGEEEEEEV